MIYQSGDKGIVPSQYLQDYSTNSAFLSTKAFLPAKETSFSAEEYLKLRLSL